MIRYRPFRLIADIVLPFLLFAAKPFGQRTVQICILLLVWVLGCGNRIDTATGDRSIEHNLENAPMNEAESQTQTAGVIRAGYGIPSCHVGMPITELGDDWQPHPDDSASDNSLSNLSAGMDVNYKHGKVFKITFYYNKIVSERHDAFWGTTEKGISSESSISEVRSQYGDPSYIDKSVYSDFEGSPGYTGVDVAYVEQGIFFELVDNRVASIMVKSPQNDFDYAGFKKAMETAGSPLVYIRSSNKNDN